MSVNHFLFLGLMVGGYHHLERQQDQMIVLDLKHVHIQVSLRQIF